MKFKIEKEVPIPSHEFRPRSELSRTLAVMEPGDSLYVPKKTATPSNVHAKAAKIFGKGKYTVRAVEDGLRVWRTA